MPKKIFISHYHRDEDHYRKFVNLLDKRKYFTFENYSVDPEDAGKAKSSEYIERKLKSRINESDTMVVLVGEKTHSRPWVDWEIEYANRQGKRIIGVWARGAKESDLPENQEKYGDALVGWNTENIVGAIRGNKEWQNSDGSRRSDRIGKDVTCGK